jgi:CheY-like chemotaxis protein
MVARTWFLRRVWPGQAVHDPRQPSAGRETKGLRRRRCAVILPFARLSVPLQQSAISGRAMPITSPTVTGETTGVVRTVLLVDQDLDSRIIYSMVLEHHGYRSLQAPDASEGLRLARAHRPDAIIAELLIPGIDGYQLIEHLKADERTARIPLLIVTSSPLVLVGPDEPLPGWDAYLRKPCAPRRVLAEVQRLIAVPDRPGARCSASGSA